MAVVEEVPSTPAEPSGDSLEYRLRQQRILADFGVEALRSRDTAAMLQRATDLCAQGMRARLCKFLEHDGSGHSLLVSAGVGWKPGVVGEVRMGTDLESPAGFAFKTGESVISNHLENEERFRTPQFMADHGVRRAINVLVEASGTRYGVLEIDSPNEGRFEEDDLAFMQGFANLIGVAIERQQAEARLNQAMAHQELLTREASHRVKNSLSLVSAMLNLQMQEDDDPRIVRLLGDAQARITAIAQAHDQLWRGEEVGLVALNDLICSLTANLAEQAAGYPIDCNVEPIVISADTAIPIGLMVTELVTNAIKYASADGDGHIAVTVSAQRDTITLTVRDRGPGMSADARVPGAPKSLGMRMINSLARQLRGEIVFEDGNPGTVARLTMPDPRAGSPTAIL